MNMNNLLILSVDGKEVKGIRDKSVTHITISDNVTSIEHWAFKGCVSLQSIDIPNSVTSIDYNAFWGCLSSILSPPQIQDIAPDAFLPYLMRPF